MEKHSDLHFKTNVQLKSIIGKDLINDDNIAILELVKNSFDADAKRVDIKFINLKKSDDSKLEKNETFSSQTSRLIIKDNGIGMDITDINDKWLNIAFSEKKNNTKQHNRMMAGAKGVGRFSCDRLGEYLNLYTKKKKNKGYLKIIVDWKAFEIEGDKDKEIQSIPIKYETLNEKELLDCGFEPFENGVLLEIIKLRSNWVYSTKDEKGNISDWSTQKLINLKKYLEKLINPNQAFENNDFGIFLDAPEFIEENNSKEEYEKFIGKIENTIFEKLDFKTTSIESEIIEDGKVIFTTLKDKGQTIFWIKEKNEFYPEIKNVKTYLFYLNSFAKAFFTKQTGIRSVDYGSIYVFLNGFRVSPYGQDGDDWLGLEQRKGQGYARFLGTRDLVGRIEISDSFNDFQIVSSREGIVKNESYKSLTERNGYFFKTFKRLEKYVVDGLSWDSAENISEIEKKIITGNIKESDLVYKEDDAIKKRRVYNSIHSIIGAKSENVIELYINEDLIIDKINEEKENSEREFEQLIEDFENKKIDADILGRILQKKAEQNKDLEKQLAEFSKFTTNEATTKALLELQHYKETNEKQEQVIKDLIAQLNKLNTEKELSDKQLEILKDEVQNAIVKAEDEEKKRVHAEKQTEIVIKEKEKLKEELVSEQKKGAFQGALIGSDKERIIGLQHQIFHSSSRINRNIKLLLKHLKPESIDDSTRKYLTVMSLEAAKINSIANFITKANFNLKASEIESDVIEFIIGYLNEIYIADDKIIDSHLKINYKIKSPFHFVKEIRPLEITTLVDNLISNSEKAEATNISFIFSKIGDSLLIEVSDNGKGIAKENINKLFDLGYTTTDGSGIGLHQVKDIVSKLKGKISVESEIDKGTTFKILL